jgi:mycofactocin system glycosyltransferase
MNGEDHQTSGNQNPETGIQDPLSNSLAYRLRKNVRCLEREGSPVLVLDFPLKSVVLNPFWTPVFSRLTRDEFVPIDRIMTLANNGEAEQTEAFLNRLVRKGFLEQAGLSILSDYPRVSVIIPVRNRPEEIRGCLDSLGEIDYPPERMEIIVVDDASTDHTPDVVSKYPVTLIPLKRHKQASYCRNLGAKQARGEILAFIDSDCLADRLWLKELVPAFRDDSVMAVGGLIDSYFEQKGLDRYEKVKSSLKVAPWFKRSREGKHFFYVPSCNLLVRKDTFLKLGGFTENLHVGEDVDLCWRLQDRGHAVEYRPQGTVYHKHRNRLGPFCRRRFDYGTSEPLLQRLHTERIKRLIFPPAGVLFWLILILPLLFGGFAWSVCCVIPYLIDSLMKYKKIRSRKIPIEHYSIFSAVLREYLALLYHCCSFVSRYYLIGILILFPFFPFISIGIFSVHLLTGIVDFFIKRPRLNLASFLLYFSLEQISYQTGVWWGCFKYFYFHPVTPRVQFKSNGAKPS